MPAPEYIAAPDSLLGLLQRGRGEGYRRVLATPRNESHGLLIQCITRDPRIDSQVESRDDYYASIAIDIELPLEPLAEYLRQNDDPSQGSWATPLTVTTLTELAKRSYRNAEEILCDYVKWGQWWNWPLDDLLSLPGDKLTQRIAHAIEEHFPTDDALDEAMRTWPTEQFVNLSRFSSRIGVSISKVSTKTTQDIFPDLTSLSPRELLDMADQKNYRSLGKAIADVVGPTDVDFLVSNVSLEKPFVTYVALAGLTKLAPTSLSEWLPEFWLIIPESTKETLTRNHGFVVLRQAVSRTILALAPAATLPLARGWLNEEHFRKQDMAEKILRSHATPEDIPLLRASLRPMMTDEEAEWGCFMIQAFNNLPNVGTIQELIDIYYHFRFSMGRSYAAEAIQITSPEFFAKTLALECLWDCEEGTRELGAKFAPLESSEALQRIRHLAEDSFECEMVRKEANSRLERIT
jgi:hypothetical protein